MNRLVLLTGGSGQVGSALRRSVPGGIDLRAPTSAELDITDADAVRATVEEIRPQVVINAAAYTNVDRAEDDEASAFAVNASGPAALASACAAADATLVHLSTDYVFNGQKGSPYREADRPDPANVYGASKLEGERAIAERLERHIIVRVSWVFSEIGSNFVKTMLQLADRGELGVVADQRGTPCPATSIARCIWNIVERLDEFAGTYHFRTRPEVSWHEFACRIFAEYGALHPAESLPDVLPITSAEYPTRAVRPENSVLDGTRLEKALGVAPPDWRVALKNVVQLVASREHDDSR